MIRVVVVGSLVLCVVFLMIRRPPKSTRTDTLFPYTTLFRSAGIAVGATAPLAASALAGTLLPFELPVRVFPLPLLRSEEHTSELQSLMRISYAVFCLKKKKEKQNNNIEPTETEIS